MLLIDVKVHTYNYLQDFPQEAVKGVLIFKPLIAYCHTASQGNWLRLSCGLALTGGMGMSLGYSLRLFSGHPQHGPFPLNNIS